MDFQSLTRRELQTLCKKNKIPANMTNVAMADALKALQTSSTVEGIEELLLLSKKPSESSIESPAKSQLTSSLSAPRTGTARRKTVKGESEALRTSTKTTTRLRSTTRLVSDEAHNNVAQTPSGTGACRNKMEIHFKESEDYDTNKTAKEIDIFSQTPAIVPASRKRVPRGGTTTVRQMPGSRRSARLAEKNKVEDSNDTKEKETSEIVKAELFSSVFGESWDISVIKPSDDVDTVTEASVITDIDLKETTEQDLVRNNNEEAVSDAKSNPSVINIRAQIDCQINCDGDKGANFETGESKMAVESDDGAEGNRSTYGSDDLDCKVEDAPENGKKLKTNEEMGSNDIVAGITEDVIDHDEAFSADNIADFKMSDQELESNKDMKLSHSAPFKDGKELNNEKEVEFKDCAAQCLDIEKDTNSEELHSLNTNNEAKRRNAFTASGECEWDLFVVPKSEEQDKGITTPALESIIEISNSSAEEDFANNVKEKLTAMEFNTSAADQEKSFTCSESEMSWVEGAAKPSNAEEESRKNISGNNAAAVIWKQLSNDEIVEGDPVEEDLNSYEALEFQECSSKQLGAFDVSPSYLAPLVAGDVSVQPCLTVADSNETSTESVVATSFTPVKKSPTPRKISPLTKPGSKTPTAAKKLIMNQVSDDKENITDNGGTKLIVAKEKKEKKDTRQENFHKSLDEQSLRMLTKMLKEKLEITKKLNKNDTKTNTKVATTTARPALQTLSENRLVGDS